MSERNIKTEDATINFGCVEGDRLFLSILDDYPELDYNDHRRTSILMAMLTNAIQYLHTRGWSEKELVNEVFDHCQIARDTYLNDKESE